MPQHATASVPTEAVVVAQPARISSSSSAARIARLADEIEGMSGGLRDSFGPAGCAHPIRRGQHFYRAFQCLGDLHSERIKKLSVINTRVRSQLLLLPGVNLQNAEAGLII